MALLDHLGIYKCLLVGSCIGPSYSFALMQAAPERFPAALMLQPVGLSKHTDEEETWEGLNRAATSHWYGFGKCSRSLCVFFRGSKKRLHRPRVQR